MAGYGSIPLGSPARKGRTSFTYGGAALLVFCAGALIAYQTLRPAPQATEMLGSQPVGWLAEVDHLLTDSRHTSKLALTGSSSTVRHQKLDAQARAISGFSAVECSTH